MFKTILVAVDGSPTSNRALRTALPLAKESEAKLYVLHVMDDVALVQTFDGMNYVSPSYFDSVLASLRETGRKILDRAEKAAAKAGYTVAPLLAETRGRSVAQAILDQARRSRADLIVLGTHGRRGLTRLVMGSDAETVLREASVPVLLVRSPATAAHAPTPTTRAAPRAAPKAAEIRARAKPAQKLAH